MKAEPGILLNVGGAGIGSDGGAGCGGGIGSDGGVIVVVLKVKVVR